MSISEKKEKKTIYIFLNPNGLVRSISETEPEKGTAFNEIEIASCLNINDLIECINGISIPFDMKYLDLILIFGLLSPCTFMKILSEILKNKDAVFCSEFCSNFEFISGLINIEGIKSIEGRQTSSCYDEILKFLNENENSSAILIYLSYKAIYRFLLYRHQDYIETSDEPLKILVQDFSKKIIERYNLGFKMGIGYNRWYGAGTGTEHNFEVMLRCYLYFFVRKQMMEGQFFKNNYKCFYRMSFEMRVSNIEKHIPIANNKFFYKYLHANALLEFFEDPRLCLLSPEEIEKFSLCKSFCSTEKNNKIVASKKQNFVGEEYIKKLYAIDEFKQFLVGMGIKDDESIPCLRIYLAEIEFSIQTEQLFDIPVFKQHCGKLIDKSTSQPVTITELDSISAIMMTAILVKNVYLQIDSLKWENLKHKKPKLHAHLTKEVFKTQFSTNFLIYWHKGDDPFFFYRNLDDFIITTPKDARGREYFQILNEEQLVFDNPFKVSMYRTPSLIYVLDEYLEKKK
jgi:hypothetical protein